MGIELVQKELYDIPAQLILPPINFHRCPRMPRVSFDIHNSTCYKMPTMSNNLFYSSLTCILSILNPLLIVD